ncbi:heme-binding protein [Methylophilaceae bacterium]|nr:heme-binding protein [Methylophilaceae bacterium]MDB2679689.1 heme-binding protein [Methylophilaceae bacterium]
MKISYLLIFFMLISNSLMATDEPKFTLVLKEDKFEIREYAPKIIAQVKVYGDFDDASSKGFKILADYIFGNNESIDGNSRIEMTAPVEMEAVSQKIDMTTPVLTEGNNNTWVISFIMPDNFTLATLPKPNNKEIKIISLPREKYAVIVFSGLIRESSYQEKENLLNKFIKEKNLKTSGEIKIARYNPPWTLPFFRRNELMIKVN